MENTPDKDSESTPEVQDPGRRRLLKALAAGGVVTAASMVPGKWSSPVLKSGVLPAHAQVTVLYDITCDPEWNIGGGDGINIFNFSATATENGSPLANVVLSATVDSGLASTTETDTTDALGVAVFSVAVNDNLINQTPVATVTFNDQATYGTASCQIIFERNGVTPT